MCKETVDQINEPATKSPALVCEVGNQIQTPFTQFSESAETTFVPFSEAVAVYSYDLTELSATKQQKKKKARQARSNGGKRTKIIEAERNLHDLYEVANRRGKKSS